MFRTERPSETCRVSFQNKFDTLVHLVGFIMEIYYDAPMNIKLVYVSYLLIHSYCTSKTKRLSVLFAEL